MRSKGLSRKKVLAELKIIREQDKQYDNGKILCSLCTTPHPIAQKAYQLFLSSNLGDAGLFSGSAQLEKEVINQLASLLHGENCGGSIDSCGTESKLLAMLAARNKAGVNQPEVVLPKSAHFSFTKICNLLNVKPVYADLDPSFKAVLSSVEECVNKNTIAICTNA